jgi:hypothetical protein
MPTISHTIDILAPLHEAVNLLLEQSSFLQNWWAEFEYLLPTAKPHADARARMCHIYDFDGVSAVWNYCEREMLAERYIMMQSTGMASSMSFDLTGDQTRTRLTLSFDYKPRDPLFDRLGAKDSLLRQHRTDFEAAIGKLKAMLEVNFAA